MLNVGPLAGHPSLSCVLTPFGLKGFTLAVGKKSLGNKSQLYLCTVRAILKGLHPFRDIKAYASEGQNVLKKVTDCSILGLDGVS